MKLLIKYKGDVSDCTNLIYSAYFGDVGAVKSNLHEKGCTDITGTTTFMWAATNRCIGSLRCMHHCKLDTQANMEELSLEYRRKH